MTTQVTLSSHMQKWINKRSHKSDNYNEYLRWKNHVRDAEFANMPIGEVEEFHIEDYVAELCNIRSHQTVLHILRQTRQTFQDAVKRGLCPSNPAQGVKIPKQRTTQDAWTYLRPSEIEQVLDSKNLTRQERWAAGLAIFTGLRLGELLHLHWEDVAFKGSDPHIVVRYSNGGATKSGKPGFTVLLPMAVRIFEEMAQYGTTGLVFKNAKGEAFAKGYDFGWRDRKDNAGRLRPGVKTRAGISRPVRFHDLRHTAAAALVSGYWGEPWSLEEVREFMRHSTIHMTQRYAHLDPEGLHKKAALMRTKATGDIIPAPREGGGILLRLQTLENLVARMLIASLGHAPTAEEAKKIAESVLGAEAEIKSIKQLAAGAS